MRNAYKTLAGIFGTAVLVGGIGIASRLHDGTPLFESRHDRYVAAYARFQDAWENGSRVRIGIDSGALDLPAKAGIYPYGPEGDAFTCVALTNEPRVILPADRERFSCGPDQPPTYTPGLLATSVEIPDPITLARYRR